jgi:DNA-binding protein H-NS
MYDDNSTGGPEKYTKEQFQKMEKERFAAEARENAERDKEIEKRKAETRAAQEALKKYGITPRPGYDPKGPNLPDSTAAPNPSTTRAKYATSGGGGGGVPKLNRDLTKNMKKGGKVSSASKRADGCAIRGKTRA